MEQKDSIPLPSLTARSLLRSAITASLGTNLVRGGDPYCSLVTIATDPTGSPLLLLSDLAVHSQNIACSPQVSLLISESSENIDPLTQARVTLQGRLKSTEDDHLMRRYLRRYPSAAEYASFADFKLYQFTIERAHLVGGFGKIHWIDGDEICVSPHFLCVEECETDILNHMNSDHVSAVQSLAFTSNQINRLEKWKLVGLDPEGFDLCSGWHYQRILFENSVSNANEVRKEFVSMVKNARN
jgi:heme oxygenase (biliverdin-IX-beta and delta-forming)